MNSAKDEADVVVTVATVAPSGTEAVPVLPSAPYCCHYCLDDASGPAGSSTELIAPCACEAYVHRQCLDTIRITSRMPNAMSQCGICHTLYLFKATGDAAEADLRRLVRKAQILRLLLVLGVVFVGSLVIWLIDRGTPKAFDLHWNGMDGKIYNWIGLTSWPRLVVYFLTSLALTAFIIGLVTVVTLCAVGCQGGCYCPTYYGGDCGGGCGDCGGEGGAVVLVFVVVVFVFVGLFMMLMAIVGAAGNTVNRIGQRRVRSVEVHYHQVENLRPIPHTDNVAYAVV
ncbi:hypothetical protein ACHHYP_10241 [Achlya hypogyna]|uniref:RING-CH-type domain-containing protein n=1 Tax=Achlya hypogyna TaxID=1202772 RepID=A0A1V9YLW2_ACHHY|nr:hypothetical protein ACHHYP_10241 [Achlya hypogyna]